MNIESHDEAACIHHACLHYACGETSPQIATRLGVSPTTILLWVWEFGGPVREKDKALVPKRPTQVCRKCRRVLPLSRFEKGEFAFAAADHHIPKCTLCYADAYWRRRGLAERWVAHRQYVASCSRVRRPKVC